MNSVKNGSPPDGEKELTVPEVCERMSLHRQTIIRLIDAGEFPGAWQIGRHWRIPASEVEAFISKKRADARARRKAAA